MIIRSVSRVGIIGGCLAAFACGVPAHGLAFDPANAAGLRGGLVVQLGAGDTAEAEVLSRSGRYLIHVLDPDADKVESARTRLRANARYGIVWAERARDASRLPYAENLVNLIVVREFAVDIEEMKRVLTPGGSIVVTDTALVDRSRLESAGFEVATVDAHLVARKPWPSAMDAWSHPRHGPDGNAVSRDTAVGPPERVRWVAAATSEVEGMVSAGGRNYYGAILARDSFNGLRLWHRDLTRGGNNAAEFELPKLSATEARPIASEQFLFGVLRERLVALDATTGEVVVEYGGMKKPTGVAHDGTRVIAANDEAVRAFDAGSGRELWKVEAASPANLVADGASVIFVRGRVRRGEKLEVVAVDAQSGGLRWKRDDFPWLNRTTRTVLANGQLVFEVSTLNDDDAGNGIHVVASEDGKHLWSRDFPPGMNHTRQARAMFLNGQYWILHGGKVNTTDKPNMVREPIRISALDPLSGETQVTYPAGLTHCFPPVCTPEFMFTGELDMTDLKSGAVVANRITKANCSRENGWVPANGLIYTTPKHCTCWPMLRGFVAMAPAPPLESPAKRPLDQIEFVLETGPATPDPEAQDAQPHDWPLYRHDRWRSASTTSAGPERLDERWRVDLRTGAESADAVVGPILHDWDENPVVKGPLSAPTIANGTAYVARPNAHELLAIDTASGAIRWRFTAGGRIDTPPAIHRGLCLFGSADGWVYALRADSGQTVWRMRAAPTDERIVAYGQVESPWPVPGAVLVMDGVAHFAAGRQPLADGGILVFAVDPMTGNRHWITRIDSVPQTGFYENSGLEFDPFDILHAEGDGLTMSRWVLTADGKGISVDKWNAFAKLNTGGGDVWVPRGAWTYGARHQHRFRGEAPRRPLIAFRDDNFFGSLDGTTKIFRRDFDLDKGESFDAKWITGWQAGQEAGKGGTPYRNYRIAQGAKWTVDPFAGPDAPDQPVKPGTQLQNRIQALALAGDRLYAAHEDGRLVVVATDDGHVVHEGRVPAPAWDGLAIAEGRLFLTTQDGQFLCLGP